MKYMIARSETISAAIETLENTACPVIKGLSCDTARKRREWEFQRDKNLEEMRELLVLLTKDRAA